MSSQLHKCNDIDEEFAFYGKNKERESRYFTLIFGRCGRECQEHAQDAAVE